MDGVHCDDGGGISFVIVVLVGVGCVATVVGSDMSKEVCEESGVAL